jgi:hypothetical protein
MGRYSVHRDEIIGYIATHLSFQEYDGVTAPQQANPKKLSIVLFYN